STNWFQGNATVFPAQAGATTSYIGANYNNTGAIGTISNWLITPQVNFLNGATLTFWTRTTTAASFPDRIEVRLSTNGASTNVGANETSVGDFTTLLVSVNPNQVAGAGTCPPATGGYPNAWCQITVNTGIPTSGSGRIAFRYFVTNAGLNGANSNYIGIDTFSFDEGVAGADLALSQSNTAPPTPAIGNQFTKTLTVTNNGPSAATSFTVVDTLPAQLTYVSNNCGATAAGQTVTWTGGALANAASASCVLTVQIAQSGAITNTANITTSAPADPNAANNTSTANINGAPVGTDLALSQTSTATSPVAVNTTFTKTLTVTNNGPAAATSFTVVDTLPAQLQFVSATCGATAAGQTVTWNGGAVPFPGTATCTLTVRVVATGSFSNTAAITASNPADLTPANNTSTGPVITGTAPSFAASVPAAGTFGLALLAGLVALFGWMAHRRRTA
ncbi:MAG TPA: choice-of-anchor J domain-containing protein, partial [Xanthomonadales bacterium]|nr:choice-of-anchor J domain-containing protein [Xanthomonadales bacterium]